MVRPRTLGPAPAIRSRSVRPRPRAGRPSGSGAKAIRNPPVAQPGRGHPSRTGIRARSLAADCSSPALGGPLLALARSDPEPHRLPGRVGGSSRTSAFSYQSRPAADRSSPSSERDAPGSGAVRSGTPPVARSSRRVEPHVSLQSPVRRSAPLAGRRVSTVGRECRTESSRERRTESSRLSSEASAYRTSPASPRAGLERAQDPHPSLRCKWRHAAAEAVSRRQRTMITSHPSGESRPGTGLLPVRITHDSGLHSFIPFLSFMLDYLAPFVLI